MTVFGGRLGRAVVAAAASMSVVFAGTVVSATSASAEEVTGSMTITLKSELAYLVTDDVWTAIKPGRVGIEPAGMPFPGPTVVFPLSFEDGWFKVFGKGGLALGPGSVEATKPVVTQTPSQSKKKFARVSFVVGNASRAESPFYIKNFKKIGTDTEGFTLWKGNLFFTKDASVAKTWNELSGLKGNQQLQAGQALGIIRIEIKPR